MSKRCKLQKEYYKEFGNYKGSGKYTDHYVKWLESEVLALRLCGVGSAFYCQADIEGQIICDKQCEHCTEYYKPLEQ